MPPRIKTPETIYANSPKPPNADVVHELVPERTISSQIFQMPETQQNVRDATDLHRRNSMKTASANSSVNVSSWSALSSPRRVVEQEESSSDDETEPPPVEKRTPPPRLLSPERIERASFPETRVVEEILNSDSSSSGDDISSTPMLRPESSWLSTFFPCCCGRPK